MYVSY
jgi:hypothetical protein